MSDILIAPRDAIHAGRSSAAADIEQALGVNALDGCAIRLPCRACGLADPALLDPALAVEAALAPRRGGSA